MYNESKGTVYGLRHDCEVCLENTGWSLCITLKKENVFQDMPFLLFTVCPIDQAPTMIPIIVDGATILVHTWLFLCSPPRP